MQRIVSILAIVFGLTACGEQAPSAPVAKKAAAAQPDPALLARLDALGDGGMLVGVLDARGWAKVHQRLTPVISKFPGSAPADFAQVADLPGLLKVLYKGLFDAKAPLDLAALDPNGALVVSLFEPATSGPPGASAAHIRFDDSTSPFRHEIVLPATDATALAAALTATMKTACEPAAHGCDFGELQVGVKAEGAVVRVAVLLPASVEDARTMLWAKPQGPSVRTPAYTQLAAPGAGLGLLIRPWRMRTMFAQQGVNSMTFALQGASVDVRQQLFAHGLSLVLNGAALMYAERPDIEDAVLRVVADDAGVALEGTHALSAVTAKALKAALEKGGRTLPLKVPVIAQVSQRVDLNALLDGVGPRPLFAKIKRLRDFNRRLQDCGAGCALHMAFAVPFSTARGALDLAPPAVKAVVRALPTAMQGALLRLDAQLKPVAALAGDVAKDFDTGQLRALPGAEVHLIPHGDRALLLVGVGVDPRTVFDAQAAAAPPSASALRVEPAALAQAAVLLGAGPVTPVFEALGPIVAESALAPGGHAFAWRLHLSTSPGVKASPFAPAATTAFASPILGFTPSEGDPCLRAIVAGTTEAFRALSSMPPDQRGTAIPKGFAEMAPSFKCAEAHASTRPAAQGLRRLFVQLVGWGAVSGDAAALAFAEGQCAQTKDAWICKEASRIKSLPPPAAPASDDQAAKILEQLRENGQRVGTVGDGGPVTGDIGALFEENKRLVDPLLIPIEARETRDKAMLQAVIRSKIAQVKYCYEKALAKDPKLAGKAMVAFTITPEGSVASAVSTGDTLPAEVHTCIAEQVKGWAFLPAKTETKVNYPFVFTAQ